MNDAIIELQTKVLFQDELLDELNQVIIEQQQQLTKLELALDRLKIQVQSMQTQQVVGQIDETPPHY